MARSRKMVCRPTGLGHRRCTTGPTKQAAASRLRACRPGAPKAACAGVFLLRKGKSNKAAKAARMKTLRRKLSCGQSRSTGQWRCRRR